MGVFDILRGKINPIEAAQEVEIIPEVEAYQSEMYTPIFSVSYNGEKTPGEIGVVKRYKSDFTTLRARGWQSFFESEITQTIVNKYVKWVIGQGLRLQSEPIKIILKSNGITLDDSFQRFVETKFALFTKSEESDYSKQRNLNKIANEIEKNALISGDVLVILRSEAISGVSVQIIDGEMVKNSLHSGEAAKQANSRGNRINNGVEIDKKGRHVAYYVSTSDGKEKRILARDRAGRKKAFLVYGNKYRISDTRGMPLISVVMETLKKLERYKEATVASVEERSKIPYQVVHDKDASGESHLQGQITTSLGRDNSSNATLSSYDTVEGQKSNIALTSQKTVYNMAPGSELKSLESKTELNFIDFYKPNAELICATLGIPPEVAFSKYDSNFSASRAALKDWEHTLNVERSDVSDQFYQNVYNFWFDRQVFSGSIQAPGYIDAVKVNNKEVISAYQNARFRGASVPHIDPLKEVKAEREKLGPLGINLPLTTADNAIETLGGGEYDLIVQKFNEELDAIKITDEPAKGLND